MLDPSILERPGTVYLDDRGRGSLLKDPIEVLEAKCPDEVLAVLKRADDCSRKGLYVAGYISYEAGLALQPKKITPHPANYPLIWLGVYCDHQILDKPLFIETTETDPMPPLRPVPNISEERYKSDLMRILEYIRAGDIYQCNYTFKTKWKADRPLHRLFARVRASHPVGYSAYLNTGNLQVASFSPELFLRREGRQVLARPMKGTAPRGRWYEEDRESRRKLRSSSKEQAENVMIVDLMRNDLGRVCETGSIKVPRLFRVEQYGTVHQMVSDVTGTLWEGFGMADIFQAAFPSGSVTGAPKLRALQIIRELEAELRGIYCGSIGMVKPGGDFQFNVAIRTVVQQGEDCEMGVGSGVVADSGPEAEWQESLLKSGFLRSPQVSWDLLEALFHDERDGYAFLDEHLKRMRKSTRYFSRPWDGDAVRRSLKEAGSGNAKVRVLLDPEGCLRTENATITPDGAGLVRLRLSRHRVNPSNPFLYHKTTMRGWYDEDLKEAQTLGYYDVLYMNEAGGLAEGARTNIVVELEGERFTPDIACGLLPGVWRSLRIAEGVRERVLTMEDVSRASRIWVGNSVRGEREVGTIETQDPVAGGTVALWQSHSSTRDNSHPSRSREVAM